MHRCRPRATSWSAAGGRVAVTARCSSSASSIRAWRDPLAAAEVPFFPADTYGACVTARGPNRTGESALGSGTPADDHGRPPMCVGVTPALLPFCRERSGDMCDEQEVRRSREESDESHSFRVAMKQGKCVVFDSNPTTLTRCYMASDQP